MQPPSVRSCNLNCRSIRRGITLLEVLTALAVVGLLLAMLLPAVQQVRGVMQRVHCSSNLKQIMLAHHNYYDAHGVFAGNYPGFGWHGRVARYLEADFERHVSPVFRCPSDPESIGFWALNQSYQANHGTGRAPADGFIGMGKWSRTADFKDGLSTTAAVAERLSAPWLLGHGDVNWDDNPQYWNRRVRFMPYVGDNLQTIVEHCRNVKGDPSPVGYAENFYTHVMPPNGQSCSNGHVATLGGSGRPFAAPPTSLHRGGANIAFADGAVRFVVNEIDLTVWWALGTRAGGETIGEF